MRAGPRDVAPDEGVREIQLSGKQLVFLFMATTVVSIVIFLSGVLVGRGVRSETGTAEASAPVTATESTLQPAPTGEATAPPRDLQYAERLDARAGGPPAAGAPAEAAKPEPPKAEPAGPQPSPLEAARTEASAPAPASAPATPPAPAPKPEPAKPAAAVAPPAAKPEPGKATASTAPPTGGRAPEPAPANPPPPAGGGAAFTVQVAALGDQGEAESLVKKLAAKGYPAFLVPPGPTGNRLYRVRVGNFGDRKDADGMVKRLQAEGPYKPWVTR